MTIGGLQERRSTVEST